MESVWWLEKKNQKSIWNRAPRGILELKDSDAMCLCLFNVENTGDIPHDILNRMCLTLSFWAKMYHLRRADEQNDIM